MTGVSDLLEPVQSSPGNPDAALQAINAADPSAVEPEPPDPNPELPLPRTRKRRKRKKGGAERLRERKRGRPSNKERLADAAAELHDAKLDREEAERRAAALEAAAAQSAPEVEEGTARLAGDLAGIILVLGEIASRMFGEKWAPNPREMERLSESIARPMYPIWIRSQLAQKVTPWGGAIGAITDYAAVRLLPEANGPEAGELPTGPVLTQ